MLQKWKCILKNWIKCYFNESTKKELNVDLESLLSIISQLRENLNFDESTSSILEAQTVEEFIVEKYPHFKFENGSVEPTSEEDIYIVASLLLFFACVISKDVDIKIAMCNKLSFTDQEVIMKFSKCLMECSPISYTDVKTAIAEACGQEPSCLDVSGRATVAETPPALRSLHCEVRRLQAALDAERFDKNYLQEELARTNLKLEKLLKDKEQHKLDIVNLKAKISLCCGQEAEANGSKNGSETSAKLLKQLQQMEEKLVETQGLLDDTQYERDAYKAKIDELKQERDKWLTYSQQENSHVCQLTDELEFERRQVQSLQDLVKELRQHNQLNQNRLDCSQLECDDPDTSIRSAQNLSMCSEVCANVVEMQLAEERAKIVVLKQQIEDLQSQNKANTEELNKRINDLKKSKDDIIERSSLELNQLKEEKAQTSNILQQKIMQIEDLQNQLTESNVNIEKMSKAIDQLTISKRDIIEKHGLELEKLQNEKIQAANVLEQNIKIEDLQNQLTLKNLNIQELSNNVTQLKTTKDDIIEKYNLELNLLKENKIQTDNELQNRVLEIRELQILSAENNVYIGELTDNIKALNATKQDIEAKFNFEFGQIKQEKTQISSTLEQKILEIAELQNQISESKASTEEFNKTINDIMTRNQDIIDKYKLQLEQLNCEKEHTANILEENALEIKRLQTQLSCNVADIEDLTEKIKESTMTKNNIIKEYDLKIEHLKDERFQTSNILQQKLTKIEELQNVLIQNNANIEQLNSKIEELIVMKHDITEKYNVELDQLKEDKAQASDILQQKSLKIEELQNLLTQNNASTKELNKTIEELEATKQEIIEKYSLELQLLNQDKTNIAYLIEQKVLDIRELNQNIDNLNARNQDIMEKYRLKLEELTEENVRSTGILQQKDIEIEQLHNQLVQVNASNNKLNNNIDELNIAKENIVKKYTLDLEQLKEEKVKVVNILEQKISEVEELQTQLIQNKTYIEELKLNVITTNQDIITKCNSELDGLKKEYAQTSNRLQQKVLKLENELIQNKAHAEEKIQQLNGELHAKILENTDIDSKNKELTKTVNELVKEKSDFERRNMEYVAKITDLKLSERDIVEKHRLELEQLQNEKIQAANILEQNIIKIEDMENQLTLKNLNIQELSNNATQLKTTNDDIIEKYNLELNLLKESKIQTDNELQDRVTEIRELQILSAENNVYIGELCNNIKELNATKQDIEAKYNFEIDQINQEKRQISSTLEQKILEIAELQNQVSESKASTEEFNKTINDIMTRNQDIIDQYILQLEQLNCEKAQTANILEKNALEIKRLQTQLSCNTAYIEDLTDKINESTIAKDNIIKEYDLEIEHLKEERSQTSNILQQKLIEIEELQNLLIQNNANIEQLNSKIEESNVMKHDITEKYTVELDQLKEDKAQVSDILQQKSLKIEELQNLLTQNNASTKELIKTIEELKATKQDIIEKYSLELQLLNQEKTNMAYLLEQKVSEIKELNQIIDDLNAKNKDVMEKNRLKLEELREENVQSTNIIQQKDIEIEQLHNQLVLVKATNEKLNNDIDELNIIKENIFKEKERVDNILEHKILEIGELQKQLIQNKTYIEELNLNVMTTNQDIIIKCNSELDELKKEYTQTSNRLQEKVLTLENELIQNKAYAEEKLQQLNGELHVKILENTNIDTKNKELTKAVNELVKEKSDLERRNMEYIAKVTKLEENVLANDEKDNEELSKLKIDNAHLIQIIEENRTVITNLEQLIKHELEQNQQLRDENSNKTINLTNKCSLLQEYQTKAEKQLDERDKEITMLKKEVDLLNNKLNTYEHELKERETKLSAVIQEKDAVIGTISKELVEEKEVRERCQKELFSVAEGRYELEVADQCREELMLLRKENEKLIKAAGQIETFAVNQEKTSHKCSGPSEKETHAFYYQVDNTSDLTHSSMDSIKTISDLEKIIHDKNRTITTLQSDITYLKSLMADSENKLLDVSKELEVTKEHCQQLSAQLKKIVHQKNEELADLKKQVSKMSATENRATEIIKVSAKYQAMILKRLSEIKTNTVLKELTNFGNSANGDNELRRSLNAGTITMEDLENFLETTDRHIKRCSEKQLTLQKDRDRLSEVNRINESEIINLKKFLTELSVSFKTFSNIKDLYMQKFSKVVSIQRTVRREILNLDGHITDATMCKLERGYAAVMQDLSECSMNIERWVERFISRTISAEKIKHAFSSDNERASLSSVTFQNTSLEVQLQELDSSFQKLLEEVVRAQKGEGAKDVQAITVMEVRAEYEDKLNRMKAKMKQLYKEQIAVFHEKQKDEIAALEREVLQTREKLADSRRTYEKHIKELTTELWTVGEKFLMKKDEADWLRRKQHSGSLMSLQQVHSSGLVGRPEIVPRPSDTHSLRSLPIHNNTNNKREGRGLHMSDEEGEVFDNLCLKELSSTPRRACTPPNDGQRLTELRWRNSLCPPHLKSSYPAETQFTQAIDEEEIKCFGASGKQQRKEVGITAYKKPGPPTPSKQAGRLSATDSELRESLRVEVDPQPSRKTSTPSRLRALFRSGRNDTTEGTPRTKRLSIFRKK